MITIDLSKQQALDGDPKTIQQTNFTGDLSGKNDRLMFFIIERNHFRFFTRNCEIIVNVVVQLT